MSNIVLSGIDICQSYTDANHQVDVLNNVNVDVYAGQTLAILGASGSGKSTLLHILGTLDKPKQGKVIFNGQDLLAMSVSQQAKFRNTELGFVYQFHHLLPEFTALENVAMPQLIAGVKKSVAHSKASELLQRVGLSHRVNHKPNQLSGGERQRVAIARAMINSPSIILADEPTGNLDSESSSEILSLIHDINQHDNTSFVIVTHDHDLANQMHRTLTLNKGQFESLQSGVRQHDGETAS
ncbi:MAG: lipoprotein-releasing ABC transporter ATP-binding protein LolD [Glaciecola sp.]